ncbi:TonB-dependent receptor [Methylopila jiangsuensis]|uniref:TonB-dependent receptor n=1 Tax=Methylopila jiangsuensis TaxID=586230 RepID=A0A9W6JEE7_9HYPH|nr:TonB-dependent receptor [Methylopila jiangsuensis]
MRTERKNHARTRGVVGGLALSLLSTTALGQTAGVKPAASEERSISFFIPAQPLQSALDAFVRETGWQIGYPADLPRGAVSKPVAGVMTPGEALSRIVEGAGVDLRRIDPKAVTLVRLDRTSQVEDGGAATALDPIDVEGRGENARGPVNGIVAKRTASATKTDTPILEAPQSISVVGRAQMERQAATSVTEVLRYVPGVVVETYGPDPKGYDWVYMRGFNAQSSSDFRDGLRQSSLSYSFFRTEPYALERVEVLRGPSSALYGQSDAGGLINKVSKRPTEDAHYQIEGQVGSYERFQGAFDIGGPVDADGKLLYRVIGVARKSNTQFDYPTGDERKDDRLYLAPSFTWKPNDQTKLTVYGEVLRDRSGGSALYSRAPGSRWLTVGDPSFDGFKQDQQQIGYEFEHAFNDVWTVRQNARFGHTETSLDVTQGYWASAFGVIARRNRSFDEDMDAFASDTQVEAKLATGPVSHTALFGVDNNYVNADVRGWQTAWGSTFLNPANPVYGVDMPDPWTVGLPFQNYRQKLKQVGVYAQDQMKWDNWILTLGGRYDHIDVDTQDRMLGKDYDRKDGKFSGRVGLTYVTPFGLAPYVSFSQAFVPTLGLDRNNQPMKPSASEQYEAGVKFEPAGWNALFTAAVFDLTKSNATVYTTNGAEAIGKTNSRGVELEAKVSLTQGLDFVGSYAYSDVEVKKGNFPGKRPMLVPAHTASGWLNYTFQDGALQGVSLGGGARFLGKTYGDAANTVKVDSWTVFDAGLSYKWRNATFALNAVNLFDKKYFTTCEGETSCYQGQRRTVIGRVRLDF